MTLLFGFAPFLLFAALSRLSVDLALWLAFASAFVVTIRDFVESPSLRFLDGASLALFGVLALWRGFVAPDLSLSAVRTMADTGLCLMILISLLWQRPFSQPYMVRDAKGWPAAVFLRVNQTISRAWGLAFATMALADGAVTFLSAPFYVGIAANVMALGFAITVTLRAPVLAAERLAR